MCLACYLLPLENAMYINCCSLVSIWGTSPIGNKTPDQDIYWSVNQDFYS